MLIPQKNNCVYVVVCTFICVFISLLTYYPSFFFFLVKLVLLCGFYTWSKVLVLALQCSVHERGETTLCCARKGPVPFPCLWSLVFEREVECPERGTHRCLITCSVCDLCVFKVLGVAL